MVMVLNRILSTALELLNERMLMIVEAVAVVVSVV